MMQVSGRIACFACALFLILAASPAAPEDGSASPAPIFYGPPRQLAALENQAITESSGLAVSRHRSEIIWTHNDSGDAPRIFAFDHQGRDQGAFAVPGARAIDWEDMASFRYGGQSCLLLADVGDNARRRESCQLYLVAEPEDAQAAARMLATIRFTYEDGPQNCEAVAVDPTSNTVLLISKVVGLSSPVYRLALPESASGRRGDDTLHTARRIGQLPLALVTAMDVSPDGCRAVVLTYAHAYEYTRGPQESWQAALARPFRTIELPARTQGESVCYGADGKTLYLTSEKTPTPLWQVPVAPGGEP